MILALDFDGVLHPEGCAQDFEFCRLSALQDALRDLPSLPDIVISSSWRFDHSVERLRSYFDPDIAARIVGVTPNVHGLMAFAGSGSRQREIEAWVAANAPGEAWVALDDLASGFDAGCPHLVITNGRLGAQFGELEELKNRLVCAAPEPKPSRWTRPRR